MEQHTIEAIEAQLLKLFKDDDGYFYGNGLTVTQEVNTPERIVVKVSNMYESPPFNSAVIFGLCEFFDTKHINDIDRWNNSGCETCDWGSSYGYRLEVLP